MGMSMHNLRMAQQRWLVWLALGSMFWTTPEGIYRQRDESPEVLDFNAVSDALRRELQTMEKRLLMFALLSGGDDAATVRHWVLQTQLGEGMSVMEYLTADGVLPSSWSVEDEVRFRASLHQAQSGEEA